MSGATSLLALVALVLTLGCDNYVKRSDYQRLQSENQKLQAEVQKLREQLEQKPKHQFSIHQIGARTFRFDAATGTTCILLAPKSDWKMASTAEQSCDCRDMMETGYDKNLFEMFCKPDAKGQ